jgi:hypothetical protein
LEAASTQPGVFGFDQRGVLPIDRVRFVLPQLNTVARVKLASAESPDGPWTNRFDGLAYRLRVDGHELTTPVIALPRTTDRYWRLMVDKTGGGIGGGVPQIELGWVPEQLLFVARGDGPFTIAFGSAAVTPASFSSDELLQLLPDHGVDSSDRRLAQTGERFELGGATQLKHRTQTDWDQYLLWGALILGVIVLGGMTLRLLGQVNRDREHTEGSAPPSSD